MQAAIKTLLLESIQSGSIENTSRVQSSVIEECIRNRPGLRFWYALEFIIKNATLIERGVYDIRPILQLQ